MLTAIAWFEKYRPKSIDEVIFDAPEHERCVRKFYDQGYIDGNLLLYGKAGTGKTTLARILIKDFVKNGSDLFRVKTRSVEEIDRLKHWVGRRPVASPRKIVYIEEFDKLSRTAHDTLKDGLMEDYQDITVFICTTNYVSRLDPALTSRFTYRFHFAGTNDARVFERIKYILDSENITYDEAELRRFIEQYRYRGIRDLINILQINVEGDTLSLKNPITNVTAEDEVVELIERIIQTLMSTQNAHERMKIIVNPLGSAVQAEYTRLTTLLMSNPEINYEYIFDILIEKSSIIPVKAVFEKHGSELEVSRWPHIKLIAALYEALKVINDMLYVLV